MANNSPSCSKSVRSKFSELEREVFDHPDNPGLLQDFLQAAVADQAYRQARTTFTELQHRHPRNQHIRRMYVALCLHQKDYRSAMDAIEILVAFSPPDDALIDSALAVRRHLGPRAIKAETAAQETISLCMIVREEQAYLGPCLNSVKTLVDEMIIIDTGSLDRSVDIANVYGAMVYNLKWCDDFSAARNESLAKANGNWILILDADEIIAPEDQSDLKQIVHQQGRHPKAYSFITRNYSNLANAIDWQANDRRYPQQETGIGWFPTNKVRLFPRSPDIRFSYPVHELVDPSIRSAGMSIAACPIPVHHYGHINEARNAKKAQHYFDLGYAKLAQLGDDQAALRELAIQAGQLERWPEAIELWHRFLVISPDYGEACANIAGAYWQLGDYEQGLAFSRKAIRISPDLKEGHYNLAVNLLMNGRAQEAARILQRLLARYPHYLAAEFMLGAALSLDDDHRQSHSIFRSLEPKISSQALTVAIKDLTKKFVASGLADSIHKLTKAAGMHRLMELDPDDRR